MSSTTTLSANLSRTFGQSIFRRRFLLGLVIALLALKWIEPVPLFGNGHRLEHGVALLLVGIGLGLRGWASGCAGLHTRAGEIAAPRLVTGGPFAHVRNPIYSGSAILSGGMVLLIGDLLALGIAAGTLFFLFRAIIPAEEAFLRSRFGEDYQRYCAAVPRWIPQWRAWRDAHPAAFQWRAAGGEALVGGAVVLIYATLLIENYLDRLLFS